MKKKKFWIMMVIFIACVLLSCCVGRYPLSLRDLWEISTGSMKDGMKVSVFWQIRLPRTFFAALAGMALSLSGMVYQNLFQNPLVAPDVLGVSGGASAGAVAAILLGGGAVTVQLFALGGGLLAVGLTLSLAGLVGSRRNIGLLLSGIVVGSLAESLIMLMKYSADPTSQLPSMDYWLMGSFHTIHWEDVWTGLPLLILPMGGLYLLRFQLRILSLGEEEARSLGMRAGRMKLFSIFCATLLTAAVVSVTGVISWIGLIVPHMIQLFFGQDMKENFSICLLGGGALLLMADLLARSLSQAEIPISILTSVIGALCLVAALCYRKRKGEELL